jgi:hypothetical protein
MAQQTAVEWLFQEIDQVIYLNTSELERVYKAVKQAKEMEKQQREKLAFEYFKAGQDSMEEGGKSFDQYYTQTYGK